MTRPPRAHSAVRARRARPSARPRARIGDEPSPRGRVAADDDREVGAVRVRLRRRTSPTITGRPAPISAVEIFEGALDDDRPGSLRGGPRRGARRPNAVVGGRLPRAAARRRATAPRSTARAPSRAPPGRSPKSPCCATTRHVGHDESSPRASGAATTSARARVRAATRPGSTVERERRGAVRRPIRAAPAPGRRPARRRASSRRCRCRRRRP